MQGGNYVDRVDTRAVLPDEQGTSESETLNEMGASEYGLEWSPESESDGIDLVLVLLVHGRNLLENVVVISGEVSDPGKVLDSLIAAVFRAQPSRGFAKEDASKCHDTTGNQLHGEGYEPL
jgi:hypothetical protein